MEWSHKYSTRGKGLTLPQIQRMGRQILEALVFLKERGFPTVTHLHSGNVVIQNGVARLAGLENTLLGFTSRIYPVVTSKLTKTTSIDIISFGKNCRFNTRKILNKYLSSMIKDLSVFVINLCQFVLIFPTS